MSARFFTLFPVANDIALPLGQKPVKGRYTSDERELALRLLAFNGGNVSRTVQQLAQDGHAISDTALRSWKEVVYARRYAELCGEVANDVAANAAGEAMEIATQAAEAERLYVNAAMSRIDEVDARDLARGAQALSQVKATQIHSARLLREQPTEIRETTDIADLIDVLARNKVFKEASDNTPTVEAKIIED